MMRYWPDWNWMPAGTDRVRVKPGTCGSWRALSRPGWDGRCELLVGNETQNAIFRWSEEEKRWKRLGYSLPPKYRDRRCSGPRQWTAVRDVNEDGFTDIIFSNEKRYSFPSFHPRAIPWFSNRLVTRGALGQPRHFGELPMITRNGGNNGAGCMAGPCGCRTKTPQRYPIKSIDAHSTRSWPGPPAAAALARRFAQSAASQTRF